MQASVIVLSWNGMEYLADCLDAVLSQDCPDFEVLVVDNGSTDGSADFVAAQYPQVRLICNDRNLGFAGGNNVGLRAATGDVLVLLNQDTVVQPGWLGAMVKVFKEPRVGVAGCKILYPDGKIIQHAGGYLYGSRGESGHIGQAELDVGQFEKLVEVEFVTGAALAIRRAAIEQVGLLDEGFTPAYYEDIDWCYRVRARGFQVFYTPHAIVLHYESVSTEPGSHVRQFAWHNGRIRFLLKHSALDWLGQIFGPAEMNWVKSMNRSVDMMAVRRTYLIALLDLADISNFRGDSQDEMKSLRGLLVNFRDQVGQGIAELQKRDSLVPFQYDSPPDISLAFFSKLSEEDASQTSQPPDTQAAFLDSQLDESQPVLSSPQALQALESSQILYERPFTSKIPVLGSLIVAVRTLWNNVSTKWYILPIVQQQNIFNSYVVNYLKNLQKSIQVHLATQQIQLKNQQIQLKNQQIQLKNQQIQLKNQQIQLGQLERREVLIGWLSKRSDRLEARSIEHGYLLHGQLLDVAESIREINILAEQILDLKSRECGEVYLDSD